MRDFSNFELASVSVGTRTRKGYFTKYLKNKSFESILECGCGVGVYSKYLSSIGKKIVCFDISENLIENAKKSVKGPEFIKADIMNYDLDGEFDLIVAADVIEHTSNDEMALKSISKVLKKDGIILISVPSESYETVCRLLGLTKYSLGHNYIYDKDDLMKLLKKTGLEVIRYERIQGFFSSLVENIIAAISLKVYGKEQVINSQSAALASKNKIISFLYYWGNIIIYPIIVFLDALTPMKYRCEHFVVLRKGATV